MSVPENVIEYIEKKEVVDADQMSKDLQISDISARNYLSRLKSNERMIRIGKATYRLKKLGSRLEMPLRTQRIFDIIKQRYPSGDFVIWSLGMLANYAHYEVGKDLIVVETNEALGHRIRDLLLVEGYNAVLNPDNESYMNYTYYDYIFVEERRERFLTRGNLPEPERLIVDVYFAITRRKLNFSPYELGVILGNALRSGEIDIQRMLTYASRRGIDTEWTIILYEAQKQRGATIEDFIKKVKRETLDEIIQGAIEDE
ncbi:hypothetical protein GF326_12755 [Candidatus Bathyarchaeota archaeon]|nr:hypothetical protein [Candidatus Bathyarchaeota archaeon]